MKNYKAIKAALLARCKNIKGFNRDFLKIYTSDLNAVKKGIETDPGFMPQNYWKNSRTAKTFFYIYNGGAYCEFLCIYNEMD